jgi:L-ascorbate metabolism protein UlaG (beta-lactamase superfamily)
MRLGRRAAPWVIGAVAAILAPTLAGAAEPEPCPGLVASRDALVHLAAVRDGEVGLTFIGHATFVIESAGGVRAATDYNDHVRPPAPPDIATMNKAHTTHYTLRPDSRIKHVLKGWEGGGRAAHHDLTVGDMHVRNVATNIRDWGGGTEDNANSIFIFETAQLCIVHLGHLHHTLTPEHLTKLGRIDVLLVPVDGGYTLDTAGMMEVLAAINAPLMIPMHYFNSATLERFLSAARARYPVEFSKAPSIVLSRETLPRAAKVLVLPEH